MESNKIFAAILLAGIIAMASGFVARLLVEPEPLEENAYVIEAVGEGGGAAPAEEGGGEPEFPAIGPLLAAADPQAGQAATRPCQACHTFDQGGGNKVGPHLWGVVGRPAGSVEGFNYSSGMQQASEGGTTWTFEALNHFLYRPRDYVPGTTMSFAGIRDEQDRANVIAYLRSLSDSPQPLPEEGQGDGGN